ncbi:MAG: glutamate racemase [Flavobacteriales bacterium]
MTGTTRPTALRQPLREGAIGIFDSGIGGLSVTRVIKQALPQERLLYFGDNAHVPYGDRSNEQILGFSEGITKALLEQGCKLVVIACNTASAAALRPLREQLPHVRFVGMEPAVKPAVEHTRTGVVGVIATVSTVQSALFATIVERFAQGVTVLQQACNGLVRHIETGDLDSPVLEEMLHGWLDPMLEQGIDALVLGCTHYPLIRPVIERVVGPGVRVIDPRPPSRVAWGPCSWRTNYWRRPASVAASRATRAATRATSRICWPASTCTRRAACMPCAGRGISCGWAEGRSGAFASYCGVASGEAKRIR